MIYETRKYSCKVGTVQRQIAFYRDNGLDIQMRHMGKPVVFGASEFGNVNTYVHIWKFEDLADRATRRAALSADPEWQVFLKKSDVAGYITTQECSLLVAPEFMQSL